MHFRLFVSLAILGLALFGACKKAEYGNPALLPSTLLIKGSLDQNQRMVAYSEAQDSVSSDETSVNLAGSMNDPLFGSTTAGFFAQMRLTGVNVDFGSSPTLDSVVLTLAYYNYYGDTVTPQKFTVYEVTEALSKDKDYVSNSTVAYDPGNIGFCTRLHHISDSVSVGGVNKAPHLRIRLEENIGERLLSMSSAGYLQSDDTFLPQFQGLYVTGEDNLSVGTGSIVYFDLLNLQSGLTVYYNQGSSYTFGFTDKSARINHFTHKFGNTEVSKQLAGIAVDTARIYVQGACGTSARIFFPDLVRLSDSGKVIINKAELVLKVASGTSDSYAPLSKLLLARVDDDFKNQVVEDQYGGNAYFGGSYNPELKQYSFNLAKYAQGLINGEFSDKGLRLLASGSAVSAARTVLNGVNTAEGPIELTVVYTRY